MSTMQVLEQRVERLERELALLRQRLGKDGKANWFERITGSFEGDPEFAEILRLGAEIRRADRPSDTE